MQSKINWANGIQIIYIKYLLQYDCVLIIRYYFMTIIESSLIFQTFNFLKVLNLYD